MSQLADALQNRVTGDLLFDSFSRGRYATDASLYQIMPKGVLSPRSEDDIRAALEVSRQQGVPILARGGGTSQCGQTVNDALVLDNTQYFNDILELDVENRRCVVRPGIVLDELNRALKPHGLWFPVDVSTASRATIGGMTGNNSCGGKSLRYGTMRDNVLSIDAILADGSQHHFGPVGNTLTPAYAALRDDLLALGAREAEEIDARFPKVMRRVGGYNIDALVPKDTPNNLAHLLVGSEGTLAYSTAIELKLWPIISQKVVGVCHFPTFHLAMDAAQHLVKLDPQGVELVDSTMIALARDIPMFRQTIEEFVTGDPAALLLVEFAEEDPSRHAAKLKELGEVMGDLGFSWKGTGEKWGGVTHVTDPALQTRIADLRSSGLNIMMSMKEDGKPVSFVEDCAVELPDLAAYTDGLTSIFEKYGTKGTWYAHASVGCLHVRPVLNMKLDQDVKTMRAIAEECFDLVKSYKGSHSGEHGDGIVRSEFHEKMFGPRMVANFKEVKQRFDPTGLFNPGKIVDPPKMDDRTLFRYGPDYTPPAFETKLDWSDWTGSGGGFQGAVEMCNNNGACRKLKGGVMCPSFRVTRKEQDLTRGRANSLRLAITGQLGPDALTSDAMAETMKLCVSCKGCKRECPTGVDMAKMKIEVQAARAAKHGIGLHDRLVGYLPRYAPLVSRVPFIANLRNRIPFVAKLTEKLTGFTATRDLPTWATRPFKDSEVTSHSAPQAVLFADSFNRYFEPENLRAAMKVLDAANVPFDVASPPKGERALCCGRTFLSSGLVDQAKIEAQRLVDALLPYAQKGIPIIGLEPSCLLTLRDEIPSLLPGKDTELIAEHARMLEEYIADQAGNPDFNLPLKSPAPKVLLHGHCHQKAMGVMSSIEKTLALLPDTKVEVVETSCCGMAGAFGYGTDTHEISLKMAEADLAPAVRNADADTLIVADGTSCRHQVADTTDRKPIHVARLLEMALDGENAR
ncbi:D-lactate dehydrogenase (Cytochrome) [Sulfitobacter noctilucicola]|uniref:FAD/FMN-containing dehydrogenase/Fe-S oxidoreductase n=1 Tax=Sulfitobacter noctilucicola TaxID=1342301 RepID=A0A7W6Q565_9RHOB|nr:FAD-binding oxidoreductase [Sulfitobacter noctilucicola]KIN64064.1 D-lactate dehydrogenase (Cytochrome) [Sulfitobacter noctilucicola]MBB4175418.1 FAD/FMN-containing dehydrogenase/Fe-S oxidoreductase [Sulfitobacter noctilucicola]